MAKTFAVLCERCNQDVEFDEAEAVGIGATSAVTLQEHIDEQVENAERSERSRVESEFVDYVDPEEFMTGDKAWWHLSIAIRKGDRAEAEHWLDRIAQEIGTRAEEEVQQGRFSKFAKAA